MNLDVYRGGRVFVTGHTGFRGSWQCEMLLIARAHGYAFVLPTQPTFIDLPKLAKRIMFFS